MLKTDRFKVSFVC